MTDGRAALALVFALFTPAYAEAAAPLEAYGRLPVVGTATVSPGGTLLALIVSDGEHRTVVVQDVAAKTFMARANFGDVPVQAVRWAGEHHLLITTNVPYDPRQLSGGLMDWRRVHLFDVRSQTLKSLLSDTASGLNTSPRSPQVRVIDGKPQVFIEGFQKVDNRIAVAVYSVDLKTGGSTLIQPALPGVLRWLVDRSGRTVARETYSDRPERRMLAVRDQSGWRNVAVATNRQDAATILGLGPDGNSVVYRQQDGEGRQIWRTVPLDGGSPVPDIVLPSAAGVLVDPQTGQVQGQEGWEGDTYRAVYFSPTDAVALEKVRETFPAISTSISSWSNDRNTVVAYIDRPGRSPGHALFDLKDRRAEMISSDYPELADGDVGSQSRVRFKASDGLDLVGYITRPPGKNQAVGLPLIVVPHDGPRDRDIPGFNWIIQAIASRGYAVLQVNYRGSTGLGEVLLNAGDGEIGRKMQTDLSDAVRAVAATGLVDARRVCIVGEGYGGYAALAGVILEADVYRCAVSMGGYFEASWPKFGAASGSEAAANASRRLGVSGPNDPKLRDLSLLRQAEKASAPVLLVHGLKDTRQVRRPDDTDEPESPSVAMADALKKAGKPVELKLIKDGDRRLANAAAGMETLRAVVGFLEKHNPPN